MVAAHDAYINEWNTILVDMRNYDIKDRKLDVEVTGPSGNKIDIQVEIEYCSDDGESDDKERAVVKYLPTVLGKHTISIFWGRSQIRNSPSIVTVKERPSKQSHLLHLNYCSNVITITVYGCVAVLIQG